MTLASLTPVVSLFLLPLLIAPPGWSQTVLPSGTSQGSALQLKVVESDGPQVSSNSRSIKGFFVQVTDGNGAGVPDSAVAMRLPDSGPSGLFADGSHSAVVYTDASGRAHLEGIQWNAIPGSLSVRVTATKGDAHAGILVDQMLVAGVSPGLPAPRLEAAAAPVRAAAVAVPEEAAPLNTIPASVESLAARPAIRAASMGPESPLLRAAQPSVSISNDGAGPAYHGSGGKKKWIILGLTLAAGAGAAFALMNMSKSGSTAASSSSINIGTPTVSVGHP